MKTVNLEFDGYFRYINDLPNKSGIYTVYTATKNLGGEYNIDKLLYVGESGDIRNRLTNHEKFEEFQAVLRRDQILAFGYALTNEENRLRAEAALIHGNRNQLKQSGFNVEYIDNCPDDNIIVEISGKYSQLESVCIED